MKENHETEQNLHNRTVPVRFPFRESAEIEELPAVPLQIGYEKTLHLIFPTEVKYYSIGGDYVIGEKVGNCPEIIRLKAAEENFPGETTLSVVTADTKFYSYAISYNAHPVENYVRVDGQAPAPHTLPVGKDRQMFLISRPESPMWTMAVQMWRLKRPREWTTSWQ